MLPLSPVYYDNQTFRRSLSRQERTVIRNSGQDEMAELREELMDAVLDLNDPYFRLLIEAIPGISAERVKELIG